MRALVVTAADGAGETDGGVCAGGIDIPRTVARYAIYAVGLFCISLGTVLQTESGLGVASLTCFATFAARALGTTLGAMIATTYVLYIVAQAAILRRRFQPRILLEMVFAFCMGTFVDAIASFVRIAPVGLPAQVICMLLALLVTAFGVTLMVGMDVVPNAPDGLVQVISDALGKKFGSVKVVFDTSHVTASVVGSLLVFGDISGFGATTVVSALFLGRVINVLNACVGQRVQAFVFGR